MKYGSSSTTKDLPSPLVRGVIGGADFDAKLADRWMGQEATAEERVVFGLDGTTIAHALDPLGSAAAGPVQAEPMATCLQPALDGVGLQGVRVGAGDIGDQQLADRQPFLDVGEVVGDGGRNVSLRQQAQQPQAGVIVVVPGHRSRRKTAGYQMRAAGIALCHRITPLAVRRLQRFDPQSLTCPGFRLP